MAQKDGHELVGLFGTGFNRQFLLSIEIELGQRCGGALDRRPDESEAIRQARDGDATAFEYLYGLHSRRVYAVCLRMVGDTTEAEDLTQEAFLRLFGNIHTFRGESAFSTWLHRLVINTVLMHLRKKSVRAVSIELTHDPDNDTGSSNVEIAGADLFLEGSIDRINLGRCIAQLPMRYRVTKSARISARNYQRGSRYPRPPDALAFCLRYSA